MTDRDKGIKSHEIQISCREVLGTAVLSLLQGSLVRTSYTTEVTDDVRV